MENRPGLCAATQSNGQKQRLQQNILQRMFVNSSDILAFTIPTHTTRCSLSLFNEIVIMAKATKNTAPSDYISTITLAAMLEMSPQTIINWRNTRRQFLPFIRIGKCVRYKRDDVLAFLAKAGSQNSNPEIRA